MSTNKINGMRTAASLCLASVLGATASLQVGCGDMMAGLPGPVGTMVENMFGLDLSFEMAGAPSDEVEQVFFYIKKTSQMTSAIRKRTETLAGEFARLFEIEGNARTAEGLAKIAGAANKIDPNTTTTAQKQWISNNMDEFAGLVYAGAGIVKSGASLVTAGVAAGDKISENPQAVLRYFSGNNAIAAGKQAVTDARSIKDDFPPIFKNGQAIFVAIGDLGKAEGIEPPSEERSKMLADKAASSAIGDDVTFS
jgi:hypothetical protein